MLRPSLHPVFASCSARLRRLCVLTGLGVLAACGTPSATHNAADPAAPAAGAAKADDKKPDAAVKARDLEQARLELQSTEVDARAKTLAAADAVQRAQRELAVARAAAATFTSLDAPTQIESAVIAQDRQTHAAEEAQDELNELEAMYQAEEFAKTTKELVLTRGRRRLEVARRELEVGKKRLTLLTEHTLPKQQNELTAKVHDAEIALQKAELDAQKTGIDVDVAVRRARAKIADLEAEIAKLNTRAGS